MRMVLKALMSAVFFLIFSIAIVSGIYLGRPLYNHYRSSAISISWNGTEFSLPPPWFRPDTSRIDGQVTFFRDHFPWAQHVFSSITLKPRFSNDFVQDPEEGLGQWEHLQDSMWSIPNAYPKVITSYYSNAHSAKHAFRCANTVLQMGGERLMNIDCIESRDGWRFDYEGMQDDASEAMSILQKSM